MWKITNVRDHLREVFVNLPYARSKKVVVVIKAPRSGKKAKLLSLTKHIRDLVLLLQKADKLERLGIRLVGITTSASGKVPEHVTNSEEQIQAVQPQIRA